MTEIECFKVARAKNQCNHTARKSYKSAVDLLLIRRIFFFVSSGAKKTMTTTARYPSSCSSSISMIIHFHSIGDRWVSGWMDGWLNVARTNKYLFSSLSVRTQVQRALKSAATGI